MFNYIDWHSLDECQRLFHGRGHYYENLSHINVDWFSPVILITLYQEVEQDFLMKQAQLLFDKVTPCRSVQVQYRCRKMSPTEVLIGDSLNETNVQELNLKYHISLGQAQNSGLFLDMRNGRQWVKENSENKNVLNLFAYTCAFSVAAIAGNAKQVVNIDLSKASLAKGRANHRLNGHDLTKVVFQGVDIFKSFSRIKKHGPYDLLICDPPSFQKGSVDIQKDYGKILRRIPQFMKPGSDLLLCLNSPSLDEAFLFNELEQACADCHFEKQLNTPDVFKERYEGKGLKTLLFKYLPK